MGMYDSVRLRCPNCGEKISAQSKAGPCSLQVYRFHDAPTSILADLEDMGNRGELTCVHCDKKWTLHLYATAHPIELEEE